MKNACKKVEKKLSLYVDGELPQKQLDYIKEHLNSCPDCMNEYNMLKKTVTELNNAQSVPLPDNFAENLHMRLANENFNAAKSTPGYMKILTQYSSIFAGFVMVILVASGFYKTFYKADIAYIYDAQTKTNVTDSVKATPKPDLTKPKVTEPAKVTKPDTVKHENINNNVKPKMEKESTVTQNQNGATQNQNTQQPVFEDKAEVKNDINNLQPEIKQNVVIAKEEQSTSDNGSTAKKSSGGSAGSTAKDSTLATPVPEAYGASAYFMTGENSEYIITCSNINLVDELKKSYSITTENENYVLNINKSKLSDVLAIADKYGAKSEITKDVPKSEIIKITIKITK